MPAARASLLAALLPVLALGGCKAATSGDLVSGVQGQVLVGPMCPAAQEGVPCPDRPLEADLEVRNSGGRLVARARSESDGGYRIPLEAGAYVVTPLSPSPAGMPFAAPVAIDIPASEWITLDIHYDSGIR
jgi:hypothetical protein